MGRAQAGPLPLTMPRASDFDAIFAEHHGRVFAVCLRLCGQRALAEDAVQEAFLDVYKGLASFRGESQLGTWIYRIAVRASLRQRARHPAPAEASGERAATGDAHAGLALQAALDRLPAEQRVVLALFAAEGLGHAEIAEILAIPVGTVWSRLHQAKKALAAALA
jgi:RNA polymerase sigma-70 factor (ECF subfamily)